MPELVKNAFDDPSGFQPPRMPLMIELVDLFERPTTVAPVTVCLRNNSLRICWYDDD